MESLGININFWKGKRVLVTGHTGFKGSWLCLWLNQLGANISGISLEEPVSNPNMFSSLQIKKSVDDHRIDITHPDACSKIIKATKPEIIFHLAAQPLVMKSYTDPLTTYKTNVMGTANILEAARFCETIKTIVVITTDKCYENVEKEYAYVETDPLGGYDPYSSSKACSEHVASTYYRSFFSEKDVGLATARAGNVIGGGDWSADRLIPDAVRAWSKNEKLIIRYPHATRPWQYVLEPLSGYITLCEQLWENPVEFSSAWNFGPKYESMRTVGEVIDKVSKLWGGSASWEYSNSNLVHESTLLNLDITKAKHKLAWIPKWNLDTSLEKTISWYKNYYNSENIHVMSLGMIKEYQAS